MGLLGNSIQGGAIFWSMSILGPEFEETFGETRARIGLIEFYLSVSINLAFPFMGLFIDKVSARHFVAIGTVCAGVGLCLISRAESLLGVWIVYTTLIPIGVLALGVLPSAALISRWFERSRGLAQGISATGSSIGGFVIPIVLVSLFSAYGWRKALFEEGILVICLAPVFYLVLRNFPADKGLKALGRGSASQHAERKESEAETGDEPEWGFLQLLCTRALYLQALVAAAMLAITLGLVASIGFHATDLGFTKQQLGLLVSVLAACSLASKILFGTAIDKLGVKPAGTISLLVIMTGMLMFLSSDSFTGLLAATAVTGLGVGGTVPLWLTMVSFCFGTRSYGRALGIQNLLHIPITAPTAYVAGRISDETGSYQYLFITYLALALLAIVALQFLRKPVHPGALTSAVQTGT